MPVHASPLSLPRLDACRILVVEDNQFNREFVAGVLKSAGIGNLAFAANGREGLEKVDSFDPDLIILDLMMPEMDGHEFLRRLKQRPEHRELPVLITTAIDDQDVRNATFDAGAADHVVKPIDRRELIARVSVHLRSRVLVRDLRNYHDRLARDLATARGMQAAMLPSALQVAEAQARTGMTIESLFLPSDELGGDLWGMTPQEGQRLAVFMVDFTGHGVAASINTFRLHLLIARQQAQEPAEMLTRLNADLLPILPRGQYATMMVAVIDAAEDTLTFATAGAPAPILGHAGGIQFLAGRGPPLGITAEAAYLQHRLPFPPGSFLVLYSDALVETRNKAGEVLGEAGAADLVRLIAAEGGETRLARLEAAFAAWRNGPLTDDLTALWVRR